MHGVAWMKTFFTTQRYKRNKGCVPHSLSILLPYVVDTFWKYVPQLYGLILW